MVISKPSAILRNGALVLLIVTPALAATPPAVVNYQGVLRNSVDQPLNGPHDMVFRFMDAATGGNEILVDQHTVATGNEVGVSDGLFSVQLGAGTIADGAGPGTYTSLDAVFRDHGGVWLEVKIGSETLSPRTQIESAAYALNAASASSSQDASQLGGQPASFYFDSSPTRQIKTGSIRFESADPDYSPVDAICAAGSVGWGVYSSGCKRIGGAFFADLTTSSTGVYGNGGAYGVYGDGYVGVYGSSSPSAVGGYGVYGYAPAANGWALYGYASGANSTGVYAQGSSTGVDGFGGSYGGSFTGGVGVYGSGSNTGVRGHGGSGGGGFFESGSSGNGRIGYGDTGLVASGNFQGGEFRQGAGSGAYARLAYNGTGIAAYASNAGENPAWFQDLSSSSWASVGQAGFKIMGSGAVSFVQNDPESSGDVIVYAAPEGDEVAVYTRGSARLVNGEARVPLGPTFRKVANPDLGLTAHVTPVGEAIALAVAEKSTSELVVRGPSDSNVRFDYVVWGLRIGFEDRAVVQPKERESFIPSRDADNAIYLRRPELRMYSARQRFLAEMAQRESTAAAPTMDKSLALEQAIGVYDRTRDESRITPLDPSGGAVVEQSPEVFSPPTRAHATAEPPSRATEPVIGTPAPALQLGVAIARVEEEVQAGDVVVADPAGGDGLRLSAKVADPLLAGIVVAPAPSTHLEAGEALVALAGSIVPCRVDSTFGAIHAGDLLTSSPTPGYAMRATDAAPGTILGKALQDFDGGAGTIRVFVMAR